MQLASTIKIGSNYFDIVPNSHRYQEMSLGPEGPVDFSAEDWAGGQLPASAGNRHAQGQYLSAQGVDAAFSKQVILQPAVGPEGGVLVANPSTPPANPIKAIDFGGFCYVIGTDRYVRRIDSAGAWQASLDLGAGITARDIIVHGGRIGVAYGTGYQHSADGTTWTNVATAADRFGIVNDTLYRAVRPNTLYASTGGFAGAWDSGSTIGDSTYNINSLTGLEQMLFIGKEDGIYSIDSAGQVTPFTPELRLIANANFASVSAATTFNGDFYFRTLNGVVQISGQDGQKRRVGIDELASPDLPGVRVKCLAADDRHLYALVDSTEPAKATVLRRTVDGRWHTYIWDTLGVGASTAIIATTSVRGYPALLVKYDPTHVGYTVRLSTFPNPRNDTNYTYTTTGTNLVRMGRFGRADASAVFDQVTIQAENAAVGRTITPYCAVDGGPVTQFGSTSVTADGSTTIKPSAAISGTFFDFYFYLSSNTSANSPALTGFRWSGMWRPSKRKIHTYTVIAAPSHRPKGGGAVRESTVTTYDALVALRASNTVQTMTDENEQALNVLVHDVKYTSSDSENTEPGRAIEVTLVEKT